MRKLLIICTILGFSLSALAQNGKAAMYVKNAEGKKLGVDIKTYGGAQITFNDGKINVMVNSQETSVMPAVGSEITFSESAETICSKDISSLGYATFTPDQDVTIPSDVEAFAVTAINNDDETVSLKPISETIPAGEGVVLKGDEGRYNFTGILFPNKADNVSENLLVGVIADKTVDANSVFTIDENSNKQGFSIFSGTTIPAATAYLNIPQGCTATFLAFNLIPSGIDSLIEGSTKPEYLYNLSGHKVGADYKGIVITNNGKKFIQK